MVQSKTLGKQGYNLKQIQWDTGKWVAPQLKDVRGDGWQQNRAALSVSQVQATNMTVRLQNKSFHKMTKAYSR